MTAILNAVNYRTTVTVVAASSGDGDTIALKFNGVIIPAVSNTAAVATNASGTVTIYWQPQSGVRGGNGLVLNTVSAMIAADTSLTSPISVSVATTTAMTS
jgi:hypothetical protein